MTTGNGIEGLTVKQEKFCQAYVVNGGNATQAAIEAGYTPDGDKNTLGVIGCLNLRKLKITSRIAEIRAELGEKGLVNAEWVSSKLVEIVERCMETREATDKNGKKLGFFVFDAKGANQALKSLGESVAMFTKKTEISGLTSNEEVAALIAAGLGFNQSNAANTE